MEKIIYSSFTCERRPEYRICTQMIEREGIRTVRKSALNGEGIEHIRALKTNESLLRDTFSDSSFFRVCPIVSQGNDWVEFEFQHGKNAEQWLADRVKAGELSEIRSFLSRFWQNLLVMAAGDFVPSEDFQTVFGKQLPAMILHGARNQDLDLLFSNLFFPGAEPDTCIITDYEWCFSFEIPLEYIYYRSVFCSMALSLLPEEDKKSIYGIAGIDENGLPSFLELEKQFQKYITGNTLTMADHYRRMGKGTIRLVSEQELESAKAQLGERQQELESAKAQLGERQQELESAKAQLGERQQELESAKAQLGERQQELESAKAQLGERQQELEAAKAQLGERQLELAEYEAEWKALEEAGIIYHSKPVSALRRAQTERQQIQQREGSGPDATIVIPTKNGGQLFQQVLDHVFGQVTQYTYEVICVDSGSTDQTLEIIKNSKAALYQIPPEEFGHGKTRNYGAGKGTGEFICFLTQDALPVNESWLENMINAMKLDPMIAGGFGRHLPYQGCNFIDARDINGLFEGFGKTNTVYWNEDPDRYAGDAGYRSVLAFFSDNNSCLRRSIWEQYPYPDVEFSEDQIWMRSMIEKGYRKVYCPDATVYHSHNYDPKTYFMRYYDEHKGLYEIHGYTNLKHWWYIPAAMGKHVLSDLKYIRSTTNPMRVKLGMMKYSVRRNYARYTAGYIGGHYHEKSREEQSRLDRKYSQQYRQRRA